MKVPFNHGLLIVFILTSSGCALTEKQREATNNFALASVEIGDFSSAEFNHFRTATIDMNVTNVAIRGEAKLLDDKDQPNLDEKLKPEAVILRVKSAHALSSYGQLLLSLVNETQETELKQASSNFVSSFKSVSHKNLTDGQLEVFGELVQKIGSIWVEAKKANAIKKIVPAATSDVDKLSDLLIADFSPAGLNIAQGFDATISNLVKDANLALKDKTIPFSDRLIAIKGLETAWAERDHLNNISNQAIITLKKFKAANAQLNKAILDDCLSTDDIKALGQEVNSLRTAVLALSSAKYSQQTY